MRRNQNYCPECDSVNTNRVYTDRGHGTITDVFVCQTCEVQYEVDFDIIEKRVTVDPDA